MQLGCLGLGVVRPAQTAVGGTFWQQSLAFLAAPVTDPEMNVRVNPHVIPGMVQAESISFFTGLTMRWFRDAFCAEEKLIAERLGISQTLLEEMASRVPPGSWGVMPIFSDRMRFKTCITLRLPLLTCPLTRINVTKRHCSVRWKKMRRLYQRVTCSKLLISRIFILHR